MKLFLRGRNLFLLIIFVFLVFHISVFSQTSPQIPTVFTTESCKVLRSEISRYRSEIGELHTQCLAKYSKKNYDYENPTQCYRKECARLHPGAGYPVDQILSKLKATQDACDLGAAKREKQLSDDAKRQKDAELRRKDAEQKENQRQKDLEQANANAEKKRAEEEQGKIDAQNKAVQDQRARQDAENQRRREILEKQQAQEEKERRLKEEAQREKERVETEKREVFNARKGEVENQDKQVADQISQERERNNNIRFEDRSVAAASQEESKIGLNRPRESLGSGIDVPKSRDSSRLNELANEAEQMISNDDNSGFSTIKNAIREKFGDWKSAIPILNKAVMASKDYEGFTQSVKLDLFNSGISRLREKIIEIRKTEIQSTNPNASSETAENDARLEDFARFAIPNAIRKFGISAAAVKDINKQAMDLFKNTYKAAYKSLGIDNGENEDQP